MFFYKYVLFSYILQNIGLIKRLPIPQQEFLQFIELREYSINCISICYTPSVKYTEINCKLQRSNFIFSQNSPHIVQWQRLLE